MTQVECQSEHKTLEEAGYLNAWPAAFICTTHLFFQELRRFMVISLDSKVKASLYL